MALRGLWCRGEDWPQVKHSLRFVIFGMSFLSFTFLITKMKVISYMVVVFNMCVKKSF